MRKNGTHRRADEASSAQAVQEPPPQPKPPSPEALRLLQAADLRRCGVTNVTKYRQEEQSALRRM